MAESFPSSIATSILTSIAMFNSPNKRPKDITKLKETLSKIQGELLIAEEWQAQEELQRQLAMISDVLYDAEDMIDKLRCGVAKTSGVKVSNLLAFIFPTRSKIKKTRKRIEKMASAIKNTCDQNGRLVRRVLSGDTVIDHNFGNTSQVLGRDDDKREIFNFLTKGNETVSVLQIVGKAGIGKTRLARLVYNDEMIDKHFEQKLWVRAPADFEITSLMREIYIAATGKNDYAELADQSDQWLFNFCVKTLEPKFLLVLDNLLAENEDNWCYFLMLLKNPGKGSKVVVTRDWDADINGTVDSLVLNVLSDNDCVKLFEKVAFNDGANDRDPDLTEIRNGIVKKCGGFPLAVKTLGSLLHQNINRSDWKLIRDDEIWGQDPERNSVISALKLSYGHLPSHLRRCLAYCSLFPKGYYFNSEHLVHSWMAQGFLAAHHENEEWEDVGMRYLKILFSRCFFQDVEDNGYYFTFKMHEPIHDFVQKAAEKECKRINLGVSYPDISARHLLFSGSVRDDQQLPHISPNLRTIIMQLQSNNFGESFITTLTSKHKYLRLLCLSGLTFKALPDSIGKLKHLRFLELSWNSIVQELPEAICKLQSLQTLRLIGCSSLGNLPQGMQNLTSLRTIILQACLSFATQLPQAVGVAYSLKMDKKDACVVTFTGDGGTSEGDFHAALNFAAVMDAPVIFICRNNGWAISTNVSEQFRSDGVVVKGQAYGIRSIRVDGNDALAVYSAIHFARKMAINEQRPVLVEALTYRVGHHSTSDDSTKYRPVDEIEYWKSARNPASRFRNWIESNGWWNDTEETELRSSLKKQLLQAVQAAEKTEKPPLADMFSDVYDVPPSNLRAQENQLRETIKKYPQDYPSDVPV